MLLHYCVVILPANTSLHFGENAAELQVSILSSSYYWHDVCPKLYTGLPHISMIALLMWKS